MQFETNIPFPHDQTAGARPCACREPRSQQAAPESQDWLVLPDAALELNRDQNFASSTPESRADRVAAISASIAAGTYQVSGRDVALKMLRQL